MFEFLRRISFQAGTAEPSAALIAAVVTSVVTTDVTAPDHNAETTPVVTTDVTTEVTETAASEIDPSRIISKWADPKPFPAGRPVPPGGNVQIWPIENMPKRFPTAKDLAKELYEAMQQQPACAGQWVLALCVERVIYPVVCEQLGWPPRPWMGRKGVATFLADLSPPKYRRVEIAGVVSNRQHYYIPDPQPAMVSRIDEHRRTA